MSGRCIHALKRPSAYPINHAENEDISSNRGQKRQHRNTSRPRILVAELPKRETGRSHVGAADRLSVCRYELPATTDTPKKPPLLSSTSRYQESSPSPALRSRA